MNKKENSPCVGVCMVHGRLNWCLGCGRTLSEIRAWNSYSATEMARIRESLVSRMERIREQFGPKMEG